MSGTARSISIIISIALLTGCVTPMPIQDQLPKLDYTINEKVLISVVDELQNVLGQKVN